MRNRGAWFPWAMVLVVLVALRVVLVIAGISGNQEDSMGEQQKQMKRWCSECQRLSRTFEGARQVCKSCGTSTIAPPIGNSDDRRPTGNDPRRVVPPNGRGQRPI